MKACAKGRAKTKLRAVSLSPKTLNIIVSIELIKQINEKAINHIIASFSNFVYAYCEILKFPFEQTETNVALQ